MMTPSVHSDFPVILVEDDELLAYAIDYVGNNPKVVAGVFKEWLAGDAAKTNAANVAASGGNA